MTANVFADDKGRCFDTGMNDSITKPGHNLQNGEMIQVPEKYVPYFKPGMKMRERVDASI
jgi:nucleoid DNA-binding protein